jgi:hypothetical protein
MRSHHTYRGENSGPGNDDHGEQAAMMGRRSEVRVGPAVGYAGHRSEEVANGRIWAFITASQPKWVRRWDFRSVNMW